MLSRSMWTGKHGRRRRIAWILVGLGIVLLAGVSVFSQGERDLEFETMLIGDLRVEFHQRMVGEAIVEGDYIVRQYDAATGRLVKEERQWRPDLPEVLPDVIPREQAMAEIRGEILYAELYYIALDSDIHPVYSRNPCWVVSRILGREGDAVYLENSIIDAVTGEFLGYAVPPPYTGFSLTGPHHPGNYHHPTTGELVCANCCGSWDPWYQNAASWFTKMGYMTEVVKYPTEAKVQSHIQSLTTAVFYELAHGGSTGFASGCVGNTTYEHTSAAEIKSWISSYNPMPFTFIGSCAGMCSTGPGTFSYEFRKGTNTGAATVGYCGMSGAYCNSKCWNYTVKWQDAFFKYCSQGKTIYQAYLLALADFPACATGTTTTIGAQTQNACIRFAGDQSLKLVPTLVRAYVYEPPTLPDLSILPKTIWEANGLPYLALRLWLKVDGEQPIREPLVVDFLLDGERVHQEYAAPPAPGEEIMFPVEIPAEAGLHEMTIVLDPRNAVEEADEENNTLTFEFRKGGGAPAGDCIDFEDPAAAMYVVSDVLSDSGAQIQVQAFQWSSGTWTYDGFLDIGTGGYAGGSDQEGGTNNVNLAIAIPGACDAVSFLFGEYGGNINLGVNGDFRNFEDFASINGTVIGGVPVTVTNGYGNDRGIVKLEGPVWPSNFLIDGVSVPATLIIGGQELWIDDICCE
ncbi:CARDB domain-containing protein [Candidatus Bipolaricaulota bacterium]